MQMLMGCCWLRISRSMPFAQCQYHSLRQGHETRCGRQGESSRAVPLTGLLYRLPWETTLVVSRDERRWWSRRYLICGPAAIGSRQSISSRRDELEVVQSAIMRGRNDSK